MCLRGSKCTWDQTLQSCGDEVENDEVAQPTLPEYNSYTLILSLIPIIII